MAILNTVHKKIIIIGAGSAGLSAQKIVHAKTRDYLLVDKGPLGTLCARVGCMPSKSLIEAAKLLDYADKLKHLSVKVPAPNKIEISKAVFKHARKLRDHFVDDVLNDISKIPKRNFILAEANFIDKKILRIGKKHYTADCFIIATGSTPFLPLAFESLKKVLLGSDDIFDLKKAPKSMAIAGAGAIGLELALALEKLGTSITVYGSQRGIGGLTDPDLKILASEIFGKKIELVPEDIKTISHEKNKNRFAVKTEGRRKYFEKVLMATGRVPNLSLLNELNLQKDERGKLKYNKKTGHIPGTSFYIAGDAKGARPILHEATFEGVLAAHNAIRTKDHKIRPFLPLRITFSSPQVAIIGQSYSDLKLSKTKFYTSESSFSNQGRSKTRFENEGHIKLYIDPKSRQLLGAELLGHSAEHLAHFLALGMTHHLNLEEYLQSPFYHPVVEEGLRTALKRGLRSKDRRKVKSKS